MPVDVPPYPPLLSGLAPPLLLPPPPDSVPVPPGSEHANMHNPKVMLANFIRSIDAPQPLVTKSEQDSTPLEQQRNGRSTEAVARIHQFPATA